jgi:hypothetical protein
MQNVREDLSEHADEAIKNARRIFDWRNYVANHPWTALGAAMAAGYVLVPRRACCRGGNSEAVTEAVDRVARAVQPSPLAGIVAGVLTAVSATVARETLAMVTSSIKETMLEPRGGSSNPAPRETNRETGISPGELHDPEGSGV